MKKSKVIKLLVLILAFLVSVCFAVGCNNTPSGGNDSSKKEATPAKYFTFTLLEDNTYELKVKDKDNLPAEIVIPRTYSGKAVTSVGSSAFSRCYSLTSVVIPDSVTSIGYSAFSLCRSLTSVVIGDSVTSIGYEAFWDCDSLTRITVSEDNANFKDIDGNLYTKDGKTLLQYATGKKDTSFTVPNGVETIGNYAFAFCDSLTSVVIGDSVTSIGDAAFYGCASLTSVKIPDSVTSIGDYAFCYCDSLTSVEIGDSVTSISDSAFYYCSSLTSVEIPDSVTSIGDFAFEYCRSLTSVVIGDSVTSIGDYVFYRCNKLVEVINKSSHITVTKGSTSNGYVGCYALSVSNCDNTYISKLTNDNGYIIYTDGAEKVLVGYTGTETALTLPSYVTKIYQYAFGNCDSLTSVVIG
ncbi:MAG: leucine-rich repeat domain-containing protein, partial [Clostridia bacterium]|nr:leucine-rich repeat domain-containing protein [Clostridia bacterium]